MASKFRTIYDTSKHTEIQTPTGDKIVDIYGWVYQDGEYVWKLKQKHNHYEETQAARDSVDLKKILERYKAGDETALDRVSTEYLDLVSVPKTIGEVFDAVSDAQEVFYNMPVEIREEYNNNPATFWKNYGTESFDTFLNDYRAAINYSAADEDPIQTAPIKEVKIDVEESE